MASLTSLREPCNLRPELRPLAVRACVRETRKERCHLVDLRTEVDPRRGGGAHRGRKLLFSVEMEKLANNKRFTSIDDATQIESILKAAGVSPKSVDTFVVDGWGGVNPDALAIQPRLTIGAEHNTLAFANRGERYSLPVPSDQEATGGLVNGEASFDGLVVGDDRFPYVSLLHVAGHVFSAYCTSPFAARNESAYVLVWDGGMLPRLYYFDADAKKVENLGPIFMLVGNAYTIFSQHFGPFKVTDHFAKDSLSVAGKVMAYIAYGRSASGSHPRSHLPRSQRRFDGLRQHLGPRVQGAGPRRAAQRRGRPADVPRVPGAAPLLQVDQEGVPPRGQAANPASWGLRAQHQVELGPPRER